MIFLHTSTSLRSYIPTYYTTSIKNHFRLYNYYIYEPIIRLLLVRISISNYYLEEHMFDHNILLTDDNKQSNRFVQLANNKTHNKRGPRFYFLL